MMPKNQSHPDKPVIQPDLILLDQKEISDSALIRKMGQLLIDHGLVKEGFVETILKREQEYPTGLPVGEIAAAIPHTDASYVNRSAMVISVLKHPVEFRNMADPDEKLAVQIVFMLAMKEPAFQVTWLKKLINLFNKPELMKKILNFHDERALADFLNQCL